MMTPRTTNPLAADLDNILERTEPLWQELRGQRILVTGATGFFGCWLLESFVWANQRLNLNAALVGLCRHPEALAQKAPHLAQDPSIKLHAADIRHGDFPQGDFSHVIHAATEASAALNGESPLVMFDTVVEGTRRALQFSIARSVQKFLSISSGAVYGPQTEQPTHVDERFSGAPDPLNTASAYAEGKRAAELLCALSAPRLETKIARCFAFVGPYMKLDAHFAMGNFISDAMRGRPILVQGDGSPFRSYMYASDLAIWLWTILFQGQSRRAYNVGSEEEITIAELAHEVADVLSPGLKVDIASEPIPGVPTQRYVPSTTRARTELGLTAAVPLEEAIRRTGLWFERNTFEQNLRLAREHKAMAAHA